MRKKKPIQCLNQSIIRQFIQAFLISLKQPSRLFQILKILRAQFKAKKIRNNWAKKNIQVPPFLILSVTARCNLNCTGCYSKEFFKENDIELTLKEIENIIQQAKSLGISIILLAGGEPLLRPEILEITKKFHEILFLIFTNGLLINDKIIEMYNNQKNVIPVISLEGFCEDTDLRRGNGIYYNLSEKLLVLQNRVYSKKGFVNFATK